MSLLNSKNLSNVFISFLYFLHVKHTTNFSCKYFNEHPHKYNLFGLSKMLHEYNIDNAGIKIKNKEDDLDKLETPFIAHIGNEFATVYNKTKNHISYIWNNKKITITKDEFIKIWSGYTLVAEVNKNSEEPNYKDNIRREIKQNIIKFALYLSTFFAITLLYYSIKPNNLIVLNILTNIIGVFISTLLIKKQVHIQSSYGDKICSLFKQQDCNNILESEASTFLGIFTWSEIGFGYFCSNLILLIFFPWLLNYYLIINIITLPYSFWSIWYQKKIAKQWCPLCLVIQISLWAIFLINISFVQIQIPTFNINELLLLICIYFIPLLSISTLLTHFISKQQIENITQEMNSIKSTDEVFTTLLKKEAYYPINRATSSIIFGNPSAKNTITILTNPHCNPCASMHKRINEFINETNNRFCIQYIFSAFSKELIISNKYLIAIYQNNEATDTKLIYNEWFQKGKFNKSVFFSKYITEITSRVEAEFASHEEWINKTGLRATPTILVNGYKLPKIYKIEDLKYFANLDI